MSTPEGHKGDIILQGQPAETIDGMSENTNGNRDPPSPQDILTSPRDSESDIPFPFDSQSSIDEESGKSKSVTFINRLKAVLHLRRRCPPGVEQTIRSLDEYPAGYGKIAAVEDLDSDFLICRKFGFLHRYALLYLQDELVEIEEDLESLDKWEFRDGDPKKLISRRRDRGLGDSRRQDLVAKLHTKLKEYDEAVLRLEDVQAIKRPTKRAQRNLHKLIYDTQSLVQGEAIWIRQGPDLAAVGRGTEYGWLNTFLEDALNWLSRRATLAIFRSAEQKVKTGSEEMNLVSADRFDILLRVIVTITAAILLLVPVFVLFRLQPTSRKENERMNNYQILTIFVFTLAFSASCSIFTNARRQEVFTATAAYAAVLVVFLGNTASITVQDST